VVSSLAALLAAATAPVELEIAPGCSALDVAEVRRVVALELRPVAHDDDPRFLTRVHAGCDGRHVTLAVDDPVSRKRLERTVELPDASTEVKSRVLALAAVELVTVSWTELVTNPEPAVEPAAPAPPPPVRAGAEEEARQRLSRSRLMLIGTVAAGLEAPLLFGAGGRWSWERFGAFGLELEVRVEHGRASFPLGDVLVNRASGGLGIHARLLVGRAALRAIAMLRGGAVQLSGSPRAGSTARAGSGLGPWASLSLGGAASIELGPATLELGVEGGIPLAGVVGTVDGADAVRVDRAWLGVHAGIGVVP